MNGTGFMSSVLVIMRHSLGYKNLTFEAITARLPLWGFALSVGILSRITIMADRHVARYSSNNTANWKINGRD